MDSRQRIIALLSVILVSLTFYLWKYRDQSNNNISLIKTSPSETKNLIKETALNDFKTTAKPLVTSAEDFSDYFNFTVPEGYEDNNYGNNRHFLVRKDRQRDVSESELKKILIWNNAYGSKEYFFGHTREPFYKYLCPETRCYVTGDRKYLPSVDQFDAILFHYPELRKYDLPAKRSPEQRYVMWSLEAPQWYPATAAFNSFFNWTMTYQRSSDIPRLYSVVMKVKEHPEHPEELRKFIEEFGRKNKHLARSANRTELKLSWLVSNCHSKSNRESLADRLKKHLPVDIYGKCGPLNCPGEDNRQKGTCLDHLEQDHKFYLSFENSMCEDYITEKLFKIFGHDMVPIVFGGADYSVHAPVHSYIDVMDYENVEELVEYFEMLDKDDAKYAEYFWWRDHYEIRRGDAHGSQSFCDLCAKLHDKSEPNKTYVDLKEYWKPCRKLDAKVMADTGKFKVVKG